MTSAAAPAAGNALSSVRSVNGRRIAVVGLVVGVVSGLGAATVYGGRVPRPAVSLPPGDAVASVEGTCWGGGSELFRCETGESGVRSLLTVQTERTRSQGEPLLRAGLAEDGFLPSRYGVDTKGFASNRVAVEADSVLFCRSGDCLGLVSWSGGAYVLAWYPGR